MSLDVEGETEAQAASAAVNISWVFSLDNISGSDTAGYAYNSGYRAAGSSLSAVGNYTSPLTNGIDRFTTTLHGGFDGYDITEREPFRNTKMASQTEDTSYEIYSLRKAVNIISSPDDVSMNAVVNP